MMGPLFSVIYIKSQQPYNVGYPYPHFIDVETEA